MVKRANEKWSIPLRLAAVLLCLTMVSLNLVSGLLAKYTTSSSGSDSARVAVFDVTGNGSATQTLLLQNMKPGATQQYELKVKNSGETAALLKWQIESTQNLPITYQISGESVENNVAYEKEIPMGANEVDLTLTVNWPESENDYKWSYEVDQVTITLTYLQID